MSVEKNISGGYVPTMKNGRRRKTVRVTRHPGYLLAGFLLPNRRDIRRRFRRWGRCARWEPENKFLLAASRRAAAY